MSTLCSPPSHSVPNTEQTHSASVTVDMKRVLVSAGLIRAPHGHPEEGKILMTRRLADVHLANAWEFPGGKVELGEDPMSALHRELNEELAIKVDRVSIYSVGHHVYKLDSQEGSRKAKDVVLLVYECFLSFGEPQKIGVSDFAWLSPAEVCKLPLPPADEEIIARLRCELEGRA